MSTERAAGAGRISVVIVDDEPLARRNLTALINCEPAFVVVAECSTGDEAVGVIRRTRPDVVFLDVQMPECDGFDVLERVGTEVPTHVVFVTAHDRYAVQAFDSGALDYLLKPFDDARFGLMLRRIQARIAEAKSLRSGKRIAVRGIRDVFFVKVDDIDWIGAADYYARLHVGARVHLLRRTITELERELDPAQFRRIHRSTIVNLARVMAVGTDRHGLAEVRLGGGVRLRLSQRYRDQLRSALGM